MLGDLLQHVIEEAQSGGDAGSESPGRDSQSTVMSVSLVLRSIVRRCDGCSQPSRDVAASVSAHPGADANAVDAEIARQLQIGVAITDDVTVRAIDRMLAQIVVEQTRSSACGSRSCPLAKCGQMNSASNGMPCEASSWRRNSCGSRKCGSGKLAVPRPSWLLTITNV